MLFIDGSCSDRLIVNPLYLALIFCICQPETVTSICSDHLLIKISQVNIYGFDSRGQFNDMRLEPERDLLTYAKVIDKKSTQYCLKGNASYEAMANNHTKDEIVAMAVEVSNDMKKHGEK